MQQYYYLNAANQQSGPVTPAEFAARGLTEETLVWCEGMTDWTKIGDIPELLRYVAPPTPNPGFQQGGYQQGYTQPGAPFPPMIKPDSNLVWAILSTILCCLPTGIYAIICASKVDSLWNQGFFDEAKRMSKQAMTWSIVGAGVSVALSIIYVILLVFTAAFS